MEKNNQRDQAGREVQQGRIWERVQNPHETADQTYVQIAGQACIQAWARIGDQVRDQVDAQVWDQVWRQAQDAARK